MDEKPNSRIKTPKPLLNPYVAGLFLGATLLAAYLILGAGLGASSALARLGAYIELSIAPARTLGTEYFGAWGDQPLQYYLVFMMAGVFLGGLISALPARRFKITIERGAKCSGSSRLMLALSGGILAGFAARLANGCTSGQALSGSALLVTGSLLFLMCMFAGGYLTARFVRRQWDD
jgi:uncharacterized membrane protein YedE/YeeE